MKSEQIIEKLKDHFGFSTDVELAQFLGVSKQSLYQFRQKKTDNDIQAIIIKKLFAEINKLNEKTA